MGTIVEAAIIIAMMCKPQGEFPLVFAGGFRMNHSATTVTTRYAIPRPT